MDDVSFTVRPQAVYGYQGPNGSGKSTTIKKIGLLAPTSGTVLYNGQDICEDLT